METKIKNDVNPLNTSEEIKKKAREELNRQLQGLLNDQPIEKLTDDNIEDEVNRLMEEVDNYEKNYIPKEIDQNAFNELKKFEEEFENDLNEEEDEKEELNNSSNIKEKETNIIETSSKETKNEKKTNFDLDLDLEDLEDYIDKDYKTDGNNKKGSNYIIQDKEIKELMNEYEKQLNIEVEREVEREYKPKMDPNDIKRADILLQKDPLINEAIIQGLITRDELVLFIDYYEIFSLTHKAKKFTMEQLKAIDDLCLKNKKSENADNLNDKNKNKNNIDLNDEDAISKLTSEIEKKLESSEDILNKKLDYDKLMSNNNNNYGNIKKENLKNILDKYNKDNNNDKDKDRNIISAKTDKSNISNITNRTGFTNFTNYTNIDNKEKGFNFNTKKKENKDDEEKRPLTSNREISNFTTEELMSVPKYTIYHNKKKEEKKQENNNLNNNNSNNINTTPSINKINNKTFYKNNIINNNNENEFHKSKTPLKPISKDKNKINKNTNNNNLNNSNSTNTSLSFITGKKTIPPIKNNISNNLKSKTSQRIDLFDDDGNPLNMGKFRGARKELVKLKMGGKSKMHELFTNKPMNKEENEKLRQKFMEFIQTGKENNKNSDVNSLKKSIVRKKIEDAQKFNMFKK